jgi:hypothetical protein
MRRISHDRDLARGHPSRGGVSGSARLIRLNRVLGARPWTTRLGMVIRPPESSVLARFEVRVPMHPHS